MSDKRDIGRDDTQQPGGWDGRERRTSHTDTGCPVAEEAHRDVRELHDLLHGNGRERGVFEQLRVMGKSSDDLAQTVFHLETKVESFDRKLDETLRAAKEELRIAKEQAARTPPMWMQGTKLASLVAIAAFFLTRLWHEVIGR